MVLGNFNLSEIIRFAEVLKGLANPMLSVLCLLVSTMFSVFRSRGRSPGGDRGACDTRSVCCGAPPRNDRS